MKSALDMKSVRLNEVCVKKPQSRWAGFGTGLSTDYSPPGERNIGMKRRGKGECAR